MQLLAEQSERERQRQVLISHAKALRRGQQVLAELQKKKYGVENAEGQNSSFGLGGSSSNSSGVPTPLPEEMEEV